MMNWKVILLGWAIGLQALGLAFDLGGTSLQTPSSGDKLSSKMAASYKSHPKSAEESMALYYEQREKAAQRNPKDAPSVITRDAFPRFFKRYLAPLYVETPTGEIVQVAEWSTKEKPIPLKGVTIKGTPTTADKLLATLPKGKTFIYPHWSKRPCSMCDGTRYVIYLPEAVNAVKQHQKRYHRSHEKDATSLRERAPRYGYTLNVRMQFPEVYGCCWTEVHEKSMMKLRHTCPICKGKATERVVRLKACQLE